MRIHIFGVGATGSRAARQLASTDAVKEILLSDKHHDKAKAVAASIGPPCLAIEHNDHEFEDGDVALLAVPQTRLARNVAAAALAAGANVVSVSDDIDAVRDLLDLDEAALMARRSLVIGAGFSPGLTCLLAAHASSLFDEVHEIQVAKMGAGGPACARQHHSALSSSTADWLDGRWVQRLGGSGRELFWFPDPIGGLDCYRGSLPDSLLLQPAFPNARRITARMSATRRDRLTMTLPMMRRPHAEGTLGAIRVEVRGLRKGELSTIVYGALDRPAVAAGSVAALAAIAAAEGRLATGAAGLAVLAKNRIVNLLSELAERGVKCAVFEDAEQRMAGSE